MLFSFMLITSRSKSINVPCKMQFEMYPIPRSIGCFIALQEMFTDLLNVIQRQGIIFSLYSYFPVQLRKIPKIYMNDDYQQL